MSTYYTVHGGGKLHGEVRVQGSKNAILPLLSCAILTGGENVFHACPQISDVTASTDILRFLGGTCRREGERLFVDTSRLCYRDIPPEMAGRMRSSSVFLGSLLARFKTAIVPNPGGDNLGRRPILWHIEGLKKLGVAFRETEAGLCAYAENLHGADIRLPFPSVGATEVLMQAACGADGTVRIENAAREPEVVCVQEFLNRGGASIRGAGTDTITVEPCRALHGVEYEVIPDRIVAATYLAAVAACGGDVHLLGAKKEHLEAILQAYGTAECCHFEETASGLYFERNGSLTIPTHIRTGPYPAFPTDAQPLFMASTLQCSGTVGFYETMFENRFAAVSEFRKFGAKIDVFAGVPVLSEDSRHREAPPRAVVTGVPRLSGADVTCPDLRAGAAEVVAALSAEGESRIFDVHHIERGYQDIVGDLASLGADIA